MRIISWNVNSLRSRIYNSNLASKNKKTCSKIKSTSPLGKLIKKVKPDIIFLFQDIFPSRFPTFRWFRKGLLAEQKWM